MSEAAMATRKINSFDELNGLEPIIKIGVEHDRNGAYPDKNKIAVIITPDHKFYAKYLNVNDVPWGELK
jgi:hypothetical protein